MNDLRNIFLTALVILGACSSESQPEDLISKEKMVTVLTEIHLLESKVNNILPVDPADSVDAVYRHYESILFSDLGITKDQYERSFNYYVDRPSEFEKIYSAVVDTLMTREKINK